MITIVLERLEKHKFWQLTPLAKKTKGARSAARQISVDSGKPCQALLHTVANSD
jgi:hypothetical protein